MSHYAFLFSPVGNGFDCHRTWEALVLGCIVIAQDNPVVREFTGRSLPIVLAADAASITTADLDRWQSALRPADLGALMMSEYYPEACPRAEGEAGSR
mmetsp:Transcript_79867/g.248998  ORF Transcript_79867/g.248998 Transcript_79867/m.248998 type:complete len:98 (+) Transcript_79867:3-296(+)